MPNYTKSVIYTIICRDPEITDSYIGSTCNLIKRRGDHKSGCNNPNSHSYNNYIYRFIRDHGGWMNWKLVLLEEVACNTKLQKEQKERQYIQELKPTLNKNIPANYQNGDVYDVKGYNKEYREHNSDKIKENKKAYRKKTILCPCCDAMINLNNRFHHNNSKSHVKNLSTPSSSSSSTPRSSTE